MLFFKKNLIFPSHCFQGYNTPFSGMRKKPHLWVLTWVDFVCRFEEKKLVREGLPSQASDHVKVETEIKHKKYH